MEKLYEKINIGKETVKKYAPDIVSIPGYISDNLKYSFFDWQQEAFENLLIYEKEYKKNPTHLMFNMATGTGKTLLMASTILYYYKQGYRKFIFFVNQNNIVDKTENNFIDKNHFKYLFKEKIVIDNKTIDIKKVNNFSRDNDNIEIKFTTIQKLYNDIHIVKENQVYLDDLLKRDIVMLADEAHHLNTNTNRAIQQDLDLNTELKENASAEEIEKKGWEHTVIEYLLNKKGSIFTNRNILLEFTATIPDNERVADKYKDKIVYKFGLKEFLTAGYTKEINLISSTLDKKERILQALLFNWYRHRIALNNDISNFKPVILFRSKTIEESKQDFEEFKNIIKNLKTSDFNFLNNILDKISDDNSAYEQGKSRTMDLLEFIKKEKINKNEIVDFLKYAFSDINCIITNSKDGTKTKEKTSSEQESLLNSLEDKNNHIRAIFTVNRLTEGWDVLNLFDIVRLYNTQPAGGANNNQTPEGTIKEKQLIGRGVRYYPFSYKDLQKNKRKFDGNLKNELRFLEELYYYTYDEDSRYISHLKNELRKDGYINDGKIIKRFSLKKDFLESGFYKNVKVLYNEREDNPNRKKKNFSDIEKAFTMFYKLKNLEITEQELNLNSNEDTQRLNLRSKGLKTLPIEIKDFDKHIFKKAINIISKNDNSILRFNNLEEELSIDSIDELQNKIFKSFIINIVTKDSDFDDISNREKLEILLSFFNKLIPILTQSLNPKIGTPFKSGNFSEFFKEVKEKSVIKDKESERIYNDNLKYEEWYVLDDFHGTSEEKDLINFIQNTISNLKEKYSEVYLLRNEEQYKIYDFNKGRGFQPDFILFLRENKNIHYQVFIEPKGNNLLEVDKWKNDFLKEITKRYAKKNILKFENKDYVLIGLPFFNTENNEDFIENYNKLVK